MNKGLISVILAAALAAPACGILTKSAAPTPVAAVADAGSKIVASATELLNDAKVAKADGLISEDQLDKVAIVVDKVGHLGIDLEANLEAYSAAKNTGKDISAIRDAVLKSLDSLNQTLADLGKAIPSGTISKIDQVILTISAAIINIKGGLGL